MGAIFTRIRFRILGIVLLAIIPAMGLIFYSAAERKRQIESDVEDSAVRLSRFLASNLERDISEVRGFLESTARLLEETGYPGKACPAILSSLMDDSASVFTNLGVADVEGRIVCSAFPMPPGANLRKVDWFETIKVVPAYAVGFDLQGILGNEASINLAHPVWSGKKKEWDVLFAVMDLDWLENLAKKTQFPAGSVLSVTNRRGDAVARYPDPDKWVGKSYPRVHSLGTENSPEGVKIAEGIDGVRRLYAYASVRGKGDLVVYVGIRREAALESANRVLRNQLLALGAVSLLALLLAWFGSDVFLIKQVRTLIDATRKLAGGDLGARSSLSYDKGELGELARAFDEMAETLEWRDAQLRESEVERANPISQLQELIESIPTPALVMDDFLIVLAANREAKRLFHLDADEANGTSLLALCPDLQGVHLFSPGSGNPDYPGLGEPLRMETLGKRKDGKRLPLELTLSGSVLGKKAIMMVMARPVAGASVPPGGIP